MSFKSKEAPPVMYTIREIAEELGLPNKTLIEKANELGIEDIKSYASKLTAGQVDRLRAKLGATRKQKEEQEKAAAATSEAATQAAAAEVAANIVSKPLDPSAPRYGVVVPAPGQSLPAPQVSAAVAPLAKALQLSSISAPTGAKPGTIVRMPDSHRGSSPRGGDSARAKPPSSESSGWTSAPKTSVKKVEAPAPVQKKTAATPEPEPAPAVYSRTIEKPVRDEEKERFEQNKKKNKKKTPEYKDEIKKRQEAAKIQADRDSEAAEKAAREARQAAAAAAETRESATAAQENSGVLRRFMRKVFGS